MNVPKVVADVRISNAFIELAHSLNTPLKADIAIQLAKGNAADFSVFIAGRFAFKCLRSSDVVALKIVKEAINDFKLACTSVYGPEVAIPFCGELSRSYGGILRRFGSTENAKLAEFAINHGTEHLRKVDVMKAFSMLDWDFMTGLALDVEDFLDAIAEKAKEVSK